jgi:hypothetical protein
MKTIAIAFFVSVFTVISFSQESDHTVSLIGSDQFIKLPYSQIVDSVNLNQVGPEQFEFFEIVIDKSDAPSIDLFMKNCRSIHSIINQYGSVGMDLIVASNSEVIRPISGFYYNVSDTYGKTRLSILYPRFDKM